MTTQLWASMPTDEDLARIAWEALDMVYPGEHDPTRGEVIAWKDIAESHIAEKYRIIARAVRAALTPAVEPLRPGEVVMIPDMAREGDVLRVRGSIDWVVLQPEQVFTCLDAAGVTTLIETLRRWQAAQGGDDA